jgi:catalase
MPARCVLTTESGAPVAAAGLSQVTKEDIVERSVAHFRTADLEYDSRVEAAVKARRR